MAKKIKGIVLSTKDIERELGDKNTLVKETARLAKLINQRFYRLEKAGLANQSYAYQLSQGETGKDKPRYITNPSILGQMDTLDLYRLYREELVKTESGTSKVGDLRKIIEERIDRSFAVAESIARSVGASINRDDYLEFINLMGREYLNAQELDSDQLIEDFIYFTQINNLSVKQFVREYKRFKRTATIDTIRVRRNLDRALERKRKKEEIRNG